MSSSFLRWILITLNLFGHLGSEKKLFYQMEILPPWTMPNTKTPLGRICMLSGVFVCWYWSLYGGQLNIKCKLLLIHSSFFTTVLLKPYSFSNINSVFSVVQWCMHWTSKPITFVGGNRKDCQCFYYYWLHGELLKISSSISPYLLESANHWFT